MGCLAWGGLLVTLAFAEPFNLAESTTALGALALMALLLVYSCWQLMHEYDELWHDVNRVSCTWAFYGTLAIGGGWSALAHLGSVPALSPLGWLSLLTGLSLVGAVIANGRRGLLEEHL